MKPAGIEQRAVTHELYEKITDRSRSPEMLRAQQYWKERLVGEYRIEKPMDQRCEIGIVIPVCRESVRRLARQIESIRRQKGIDPALIEIIYVVNNDVDDESVESQNTIEINAKAMDFLRQDHGLCIHIIDKSSSGNAIPNCNVGRARNRGVAEISLRFHENKRNGILLQTDADCWWEDPAYLVKVKQIFDEDPDIIGIAGGVIMEWDPDAEDVVVQRAFEEKIPRVILRLLLSTFTEFLRHRDLRRMNDKHFSGAHMLSRSLEAAQIGGLIDAVGGEDPQFGTDLMDHAALYGQKVIGMRDSLYTVSAFRESDRTSGSFRHVFDSVITGLPDMVPDVLVKKDLSIFRAEIDDAFLRAYNAKDHVALRCVMTDANGELIVSEEAFSELCVFMDRFSYQESDQFLADFRQKHFGDQSQVRLLYDIKYPRVELTEEYIEKVKDRVRSLPDGEKFVKQIEKAVGVFRFAK